MIDRTVSVQEAEAYLGLPVTDAERDDVLALVRWFRRRYATPSARLAYIRRAYARWTRNTAKAASAREK